MKQLSTLDNIFIAMEGERHPLHIGNVNIYESVDDKGQVLRFKDVLANFRDKLPLTPILRRRLKKTPFGIDSPYWIDDKNFDLEYHVRHIALPQPGDFRQLAIQTSRIWARPLDLSRPPWEAYIIEGLNNVEGVKPGSFAMVFKIHHAACDGLSALDVISRLHTEQPRSDKTFFDNFEPDDEPTGMELLTRAYLNWVRSPVKFAQRYRNMRKARPKARQEEGLRELPKTEATRFNENVEANRVFLSETFKISDLKIIKNAADATINDVVVAIVSGALRKYLADKDELPKGTMTAGLPVNTRTSADRPGGNQVSFMFVSLCSDIEDPMQRLKAVTEDIKANKKYKDAVQVRQQTDLINGLPSSLMAAGLRVATLDAISDRAGPFYTTLITNVPGPQSPIYFCGAKMIKPLGLGAPVDKIGLFHTVNSYCGELYISPVSCREMLPDPDFYSQCLRESFEELLEATRPPKKRKRPSNKSKKVTDTSEAS